MIKKTLLEAEQFHPNKDWLNMKCLVEITSIYYKRYPNQNIPVLYIENDLIATQYFNRLLHNENLLPQNNSEAVYSNVFSLFKCLPDILDYEICSTKLMLMSSTIGIFYNILNLL